MAKELTDRERAKLGGLRAADNMTPEQRQERARKGGKAVAAARGKEFYVRLAMRRWGKSVEISGRKPLLEKALKIETDRRQAEKAALKEKDKKDRAWAKDFIMRRGTRGGAPAQRPSLREAVSDDSST